MWQNGNIIRTVPYSNEQGIRIVVIGMYGLLVIGPTFHWWYGKLEELTARLPERFRFIAKLLLDRLVFTPPFLVVTLLYRKLFEKSSTAEKIAELKRIFLGVLIVNWKVRLLLGLLSECRWK